MPAQLGILGLMATNSCAPMMVLIVDQPMQERMLNRATAAGI